MLREMLALLSEGKMVSQYDLADRLNATTETIAARLDFLHRAGYLRKICAVKNCSKSCHGCMGCGPETAPPVMWEMVWTEAVPEKII
jgi:DNA-binding Lrp family transcriptional regulator